MSSQRHEFATRRPIGSVLLTPGPALFTGTWDGRRHSWEEFPHKPGRPEEFFRGEKHVGQDSVVTGIVQSRDGQTIACACTAGFVLVYRSHCPVVSVVVSEEEEVDQLFESVGIGDSGEVYLKTGLDLGGVALEENYRLLPEAAFSSYSTRRDLRKLKLPAELRFRFTGCLTHGSRRAWRRLPHKDGVLCLALSAEGIQEMLYSGSRDRTIRKWCLATGVCLHTYEGHTSMVRCLAVNQKFLATGGDDRTLRVWEKGSPSLLRTIPAHGDFVRSVSLCPTFQERLASAGDDMRVSLWDASAGTRLLEYSHSVAVAAIVLNGSMLLTACADGRARVWRTETGALEREIKHPAAVTALSVL